MRRPVFCTQNFLAIVPYIFLIYVIVVMATLSYIDEEERQVSADSYDEDGAVMEDVTVTERMRKEAGLISDSHHFNEMFLGRNALERLERTPLLVESDIQVLGRRRPNKVFLSIGLPTTQRPHVGMDYFRRTLECLVTRTDEDEKARSVIVVLIADLDPEYRFKVIDHITDIYQKHLNSGFIQVIQVAASAYPPLTGLPRTGNKEDPALRRWRAKQVVDYAFLFHHARNISDYYLQLEDDVICARSFVDLIDVYVSEQRRSWFVLRFSELGFIGKLFRSADLGRLAQFFLAFYRHLAADALYEQFAKLINVPFMPLRTPTLFQHIGEYPSLQTEDVQKLDRRRDRHFVGAGAGAGVGVRGEEADDDIADDMTGLLQKLGPPHNPPADLHTTVTPYMNFTVERAYSLDPDRYFWGTAPKLGDTLHIIFKTPYPLEAISIDTGKPGGNSDFLRNAELSASPFAVPKKRTESGAPLCYDYEPLGEFSGGRLEIDGINKKLDMPIMCLMIKVTEKQKDWLIISQINVWTVK